MKTESETDVKSYTPFCLQLPIKKTNSDTKLKIELESCRRRFKTYSGAFWIGAQKKLNFFSGTSMAQSNVHGAL